MSAAIAAFADGWGAGWPVGGAIADFTPPYAPFVVQSASFSSSATNTTALTFTFTQKPTVGNVFFVGIQGQAGQNTIGTLTGNGTWSIVDNNLITICSKPVTTADAASATLTLTRTFSGTSTYVLAFIYEVAQAGLCKLYFKSGSQSSSITTSITTCTGNLLSTVADQSALISWSFIQSTNVTLVDTVGTLDGTTSTVNSTYLVGTSDPFLPYGLGFHETLTFTVASGTTSVWISSVMIEPIQETYVRQYGSVVYSSGALPSITMNMAPLPNSILLAIVYDNFSSPPAIGIGTGYTQIDQQVFLNSRDFEAEYTLLAATKIAGSSESATQTPFTETSPTFTTQFLIEIAGSMSDVLLQHSSKSQSNIPSSGVTLTPDLLTPIGGSAMLLLFVFSFLNNQGSTANLSPGVEFDVDWTVVNPVNNGAGIFRLVQPVTGAIQEGYNFAGTGETNTGAIFQFLASTYYSSLYAEGSG
jgi:hypothetical protein